MELGERLLLGAVLVGGFLTWLFWGLRRDEKKSKEESARLDRDVAKSGERTLDRKYTTKDSTILALDRKQALLILSYKDGRVLEIGFDRVQDAEVAVEKGPSKRWLLVSLGMAAFWGVILGLFVFHAFTITLLVCTVVGLVIGLVPRAIRSVSLEIRLSGVKQEQLSVVFFNKSWTGEIDKIDYSEAGVEWAEAESWKEVLKNLDQLNKRSATYKEFEVQMEGLMAKANESQAVLAGSTVTPDLLPGVLADQWRALHTKLDDLKSKRTIDEFEYKDLDQRLWTVLKSIPSK